MSDGIGCGRNYWQQAAKEFEEEKQMLQQQVSALTTANANLASLVGEMREWVEVAIGQMQSEQGYEEQGSMAWNDWSGYILRAQAALARTPEQAGERRRNLEKLAKAVQERMWESSWCDFCTGEWVSEDRFQHRVDCPLAALAGEKGETVGND